MSRLGFQPVSENIMGSVGQAYSKAGVDQFADTDTHTGNWKTIVVLDATTQITAITDSGSEPSTILMDTALPLGTLITANGVFTSITLGVAGAVSMGRAVQV